MKAIINVDELEFGSHQHGDQFEASGAQVSRRIGGSKLGYGVTVVPPGKRAWPYHNHHANEEMFFVLSGTGKVRLGADEYAIRAGDFIAAPAGGRATAHQIINDSDAELRYISVSTMIRPEIVEYPDSNKYAATSVHPGEEAGFRHLGVLTPSVDYWHDEG